jgi:hypothetical protein
MPFEPILLATGPATDEIHEIVRIYRGPLARVTPCCGTPISALARLRHRLDRTPSSDSALAQGPDMPTLEKEVAAWENHRNKHHAKANWQFPTDDACVKLKRLYPHFE